MKVLEFKPSRMELPNNGKRKFPLFAEVLGTVEKNSAGRTVINTEAYRGADIVEVAAYLKSRGVDPAQAMIEGLNAMNIVHVRRSNPSLQQSLLDRGVVDTEAQARVAAIHIAKAAETFHIPPDRLVASLDDMIHGASAPDHTQKGKPKPQQRPPAPTHAGHEESKQF